jgi:hypothetical protein
VADNLALWNKLGKTDPRHTKGFKRSGGFTGTAIKPIYTTHKMTETFGPCGVGWGMGEPVFQVVPGHNGEVLVYCTVMLWWSDDGELHESWGVGGDKVVSHVKANEQYNRPERWENDDEAFKKAFTDAIGNAMKHLGMSADVHMGLFEDSKYVSDRRREEEAHDNLRGSLEASTTEPPPVGSSEPAKGKFKYGDMRVADMRPLWSEMRDELDRANSLSELTATWLAPAFQAELKKLKPDWQTLLLEHKEAAKAIFLKALPEAANVGKHLDNLDAQGAGGEA